MQWQYMLRIGVVIAMSVATLGAALAQDEAMPSDPRFRHIIDPEQRLHVYRLHQVSALYRECDKRRVGVLECSIDEIARIEQARVAKPERSARPARVASPPTIVGAAVPAPEPLPELPNVPRPNTSTVTPFLRKDMPDISLFSRMKPAKNATGAEISYAHNRIAKNDIWAVHGIAGFAYQIFGDYSRDESRPSLLAAYVAPYVLVDKTFNTAVAQRSNNTDTVTAGLKVEAGVDNLLGGQQYFRIGGAGVFDRLDDTTAVSVTAEWIPVYDRLIHHPETLLNLLVYRFDPVLMVQFDSTTDQTKPLLFSGRNQSLRIGPQLSLFVQALPRTVPILANFHANLTYHWAYETYSGRKLHWFESALSYNLDPAGHVGLNLTYRKGNDEATGKQVDIAKLTLSGKI
jgi:hypothetical protein